MRADFKIENGAFNPMLLLQSPHSDDVVNVKTSSSKQKGCVN